MKKLGMILDLSKNDSLDWSQGPQVLLRNQEIRVFFSTRRREGDFYFSDITFVDFDNQFKELKRFASKPVIDRGNLGTFDHDGIFPFHVFRTSDTNPRIFAFTCGWKRKLSVDIDMAIGIAQSQDGGETFSRLGEGPILAANLREPFLIGDPFVFFSKGLFHMLYICGNRWMTSSDGRKERQYSIVRASSGDLISWDRPSEMIIPARLVNEAQAMPSLIEIDGVYHLIYCYRDVFDFRSNPQKSYKIGHAFSHDLIKWHTTDFTIPAGELGAWDSEMQCYPHIFEVEDRVYILYNGNSFGRFGIGLVQLSREELKNYARF